MFKRFLKPFLKASCLLIYPANSLGNLIGTTDAITADLSINVNKRKGCLLVC